MCFPSLVPWLPVYLNGISKQRKCSSSWRVNFVLPNYDQKEPTVYNFGVYVQCDMSVAKPLLLAFNNRKVSNLLKLIPAQSSLLPHKPQQRQQQQLQGKWQRPTTEARSAGRCWTLAEKRGMVPCPYGALVRPESIQCSQPP